MFNVETGAAATLRYAIYPTGNDGYHISYHTNVFMRCYLWKSAILECFQILQFGLVNWHCYKFYTGL